VENCFKFLEDILNIRDKALQKEFWNSMSNRIEFTTKGTLEKKDEFFRHLRKEFKIAKKLQNSIDINVSKYKGTYRHKFLREHGGEIIEYHCKYKLRPQEILNSEVFKHRSNKPKHKTIESFLKREGVWQFENDGKTDKANKFQKNRAKIKKLFFEGYSNSEVQNEINSNDEGYVIDLYTIQKYCEKLEAIQICEKEIIKNHFTGLSCEKLFTKLKDKDKDNKIISLNLVKKTIKNHINKSR